MEPFELVITLIIADLATIPMAEQTIPIWYGVVPLLVITVVHFIFSFITQKSTLMRDVISGKPVIVIDEGNIDIGELKKLNMCTEELMEQLRNLNYFDISDINFAIVERNGKITVIPKAAGMPSTREDHKIKIEESEIQYNIIENGKIIKRNFKEIGQCHKIEDIMQDILHNMKCKQEDLVFACLSEGGQVYAQKAGKDIQDFQIKLTTNKEAELLDTKQKKEAAK